MATGKEIILWKDDVQGITYYRREGAKKAIIYAYFSLDSKRIRFSTKSTDRKQAAIVAQEKYALAGDGKSVKNISFRKLSKEFLEDKKNRVVESTYKQYKSILGYVDEFLGDIDVRKITDKKVKELEKWRRNYYKNHPKKISQKYKRNGKVIKNGREYSDDISNRTINLTVGLTIAVLNYAKSLGYIEQHHIPSTWKKLKERKREEWVEQQDFLKLYKYYENSGNVFYACIIGFCYFTGVRIMSEINRLQWKDVDFENQTVLIRNRKHKSQIVNSLVPLFPESLIILEKMKEMHRPVSGNNFVFRNKNGRQVQSINKSFKTAVKKCGLSDRITPYALRHSFATCMVESTGIPMQMIAKIMGHADTQMLEKTYGHLRDNVAANTALKEHAKSKKDGRISKSIVAEEVPTVVDIDMRSIFKMYDTLRGTYDESLVRQMKSGAKETKKVKKKKKKTELRIVGSDRKQ